MTFQQYNKGKPNNITGAVVIFFLVCIVFWLLASSMNHLVEGQAVAEQQTPTVEPTPLPVVPPALPPVIPESIVPEEEIIPDTYIPVPIVPLPDPPSIFYRSCAQAPGPLFRGEPGYRSGLDRDGDGIACDIK